MPYMICLDPGFKKRSSKEEFREHGKLNYRFYIRKILTLILMLNFLSVVKSLQLDSGTALVLGTVKDHRVIHFLQMVWEYTCPEQTWWVGQVKGVICLFLLLSSFL